MNSEPELTNTPSPEANKSSYTLRLNVFTETKKEKNAHVIINRMAKPIRSSGYNLNVFDIEKYYKTKNYKFNGIIEIQAANNADAVLQALYICDFLAYHFYVTPLDLLYDGDNNVDLLHGQAVKEPAHIKISGIELFFFTLEKIKYGNTHPTPC